MQVAFPLIRITPPPSTITTLNLNYTTITTLTNHSSTPHSDYKLQAIPGSDSTGGYIHHTHEARITLNASKHTGEGIGVFEYTQHCQLMSTAGYVRAVC